MGPPRGGANAPHANRTYKLALRALPSHDINASLLTPSEVETLKSWFEGDPTGMSTAQLAQEVIQQEMEKQKKAGLRSASV
jgi:hypothetical protein